MCERSLAAPSCRDGIANHFEQRVSPDASTRRCGGRAARGLSSIHALVRSHPDGLGGVPGLFDEAHINRLGEDGVRFRSIVDGAWVDLGPERSMEVQNNIGADIIMAFDDCPPAGDPKEVVGFRKRVTTDGHRGLEHHDRLRDAHEPHHSLAGPMHQSPSASERASALWHRARRHRSRAQGRVRRSHLPARLAGLRGWGRCGWGTARTNRGSCGVHRTTLVAAEAALFDGVGYEQDIVHAVRSGIDMFDCVLPTRNARNAQAFTRSGRMNLKNAKFAEDDAPIDASCDCATCTGGYSRAYIRHLLNASESMAGSLVATHNLRHFQRLMLDIRQAIRDNDWSAFRAGWPGLRTDLAPLS